MKYDNMAEEPTEVPHRLTKVPNKLTRAPSLPFWTTGMPVRHLAMTLLFLVLVEVLLLFVCSATGGTLMSDGWNRRQISWPLLASSLMVLQILRISKRLQAPLTCQLWNCVSPNMVIQSALLSEASPTVVKHKLVGPTLYMDKTMPFEGEASPKERLQMLHLYLDSLQCHDLVWALSC